jgi:hypothetical protein
VAVVADHKRHRLARKTAKIAHEANQLVERPEKKVEAKVLLERAEMIRKPDAYQLGQVNFLGSNQERQVHQDPKPVMAGSAA